MKRSMSLAMKIGLGFGGLILVMAVIGLVNWHAQKSLKASEALLDKGHLCVDAVNGCAALRRDFAIYKFDKLPGSDKNAAEAWLLKYDDLVSNLNDLKGSAGLNGEERAKVDQILDIAKPYKATFETLKSAQESKDEAFASWRKIGGSMTEVVHGLEGTFSTHLERALTEKSADDYVKWSTIQKNFQEDINARFLLLRTKALYLLATEKDAEWDGYAKQLAVAREGLAQWADSTKGDGEMQKIAAQVSDGLKGYDDAGELMHASILKHREATAQILVLAKDLVGKITTISNDLNQEMNATMARANVTSAALIIFGSVLGILVAIVTTLSITRPINRVIKGLTSGSEQVSSASTQVASASQSLAQGASEQASSLEETSSSLEEMSSMTRQNADNANQANVVAKESSEHAEAGVESMKRMTDAIERIKNSASETAKIIKTIDEIAFQTNLLALNAAVEAARAGEAGKGFAVVAEEVRNLARRSAEAAKNTADLIEGAQKNAEAGVSVTAEVAKNLGGIKDSAGKVAALIAEIAAASKEQSQGIDQINTAVAEMDKVVQQNAANAEESSSAAEELSSQSQELNAMVADLVRIIGGSSADQVTATAKPRKADLAAATRVIASKRETLPAPKAPPAPRHAKGNGHAERPAAKSPKPEQVIPLDEQELTRF
ncbi:MAG TPA: methyl-accepting chemotaxis protein [Verrucomicrobiae bacterium]|nr:methyl-accepting chemotaxis protein [Verrucomicrobiae bacterium]